MVTLKGKVVLITGASSGIGRAAALAFARKGARLVLAARRIEKLKSLESAIRQYETDCLSVQTDLTRLSDIDNLFTEIRETFGRLDILINNAGRGLKATLLETEPEEWSSVMQTNLDSVYRCSRKAAAMMSESGEGGQIITVSSIAGLFGAPTYSAYCASKHAVTGFMRAIKWELRKHHIRCTTIHPGRIDTEFFEDYPKKPPRSQMLTAHDIAQLLLAIAEKSFFKAWGIRLLNFGRRIYYAIRYSIS